MVHLICGPTGAGKTAYAAALAQRTGAVRFSIDEWMSRLFLVDRPDRPDPTWMGQRMERCEVLIWEIADQLIAKGIDLVFDLDLSKRDDRDRMRTHVAQTRAQSKLHYLDIGPRVRRARLLERSRDRADGGDVGAETLEHADGSFEPPTDDELYGAMIVCED